MRTSQTAPAENPPVWAAATPRAQEDGAESIHIFFHALRHPDRGLYIVDTGVEGALRDTPAQAAIRGPVAQVMRVEAMTFHHDTAGWLAQQPQPLAGVLLTHLHLDHVSGMPDVPLGTRIYAGPGEPAALHVFVQPTIDRALAGHGPLRSLAKLRAFAAAHPGIDVRLGHQHLHHGSRSAARTDSSD